MKPSKRTTWPVARRPTWPSALPMSTTVRSSRASAIWEASVRFQMRS
jgi:hypothetical protein